jgi:hypothetical protein
MRVRHTRGETGPPAQSRARATYYSVVSVALLLSASESAVAPASPIWLLPRLQRGDESQTCSWRDRAAGTAQGAHNLLEHRQRHVAFESLRERRSARGADLFELQAAAMRGGSGMLVARQAAGAKQGARDLLQLSQQTQCIRKLATVPPAFEHLKHNCFCQCVHLCVAPNASPNSRLLKSPR